MSPEGSAAHPQLWLRLAIGRMALRVCCWKSNLCGWECAGLPRDPGEAAGAAAWRAAGGGRPPCPAAHVLVGESAGGRCILALAPPHRQGRTPQRQPAGVRHEVCSNPLNQLCIVHGCPVLAAFQSDVIVSICMEEERRNIPLRARLTRSTRSSSSH